MKVIIETERLILREMVPGDFDAMKCGMKFIKEYDDPDNVITKVYGISREEWAESR